MDNFGTPTTRAVIYNAAPAIAFFALFLTTCAELFLFRKRTRSLTLADGKRKTALWISRAVLLVFIADAALVFVQLYIQKHYPSYADRLFNDLSSLLTWACVCWSLAESSNPYTLPYIAFWLISGAADLTILVFEGSKGFKHDTWATLHVLSLIVRIVLTWAAIIWSLNGARTSPEVGTEDSTEDETQSLLDPESQQVTARYEAIPSDDHDHDSEVDDNDKASDNGSDSDEDEKEIIELQQKRLREQGGWVGYLGGFLTFLPHLLPYKDRFTQVWLLIMLLCIGLERVLTLMIPRQLGAITEELGNSDFRSGQLPWKQLLIWGFLQFPLSTGSNMVKCIGRTRISQFAYARLKAAAFSHVMNLSMDYHSMKSSGKLTKAIEQGTDLTSVVDNIVTTVPTLIDLVIAAIYLTVAFDRFMGLIVIATMVGYVLVSLKKNTITSKMERVSSEKSRVESEVLYDSVTNWQTVAYHNRKKFEEDRYAVTVKNTIMAERSYYDWTDYSVFLQDCILDAGLLTAATLASYRVATGASPLSGFVFLIMYWVSVREPISMIAWTFHETAAHLINAEWLFQLLQTKPTIVDKPGAKDLVVSEGKVIFDDVNFSYDPERPILQGLSFVAEPGKTIALVGETGGGKSTILKLLYRFYDVTSGKVTIDGQGVRDITLDSLRENLGIVPQDPCVFDQTILQNILYARPEATIEDVHAACRAAHIHDQIQKFPQGYNSRIGERGVKLSGGELQRLAIARVILRKPSIVILDEATSAVDSVTEVSVQKALKALSRDRTVFMVAHRLSTIVKADQIMLIEGGKVVERGTHDELLEKNGRYHRLWHMQTVVGET